MVSRCRALDVGRDQAWESHQEAAPESLEAGSSPQRSVQGLGCTSCLVQGAWVPSVQLWHPKRRGKSPKSEVPDVPSPESFGEPIYTTAARCLWVSGDNPSPDMTTGLLPVAAGAAVPMQPAPRGMTCHLLLATGVSGF